MIGDEGDVVCAVVISVMCDIVSLTLGEEVLNACHKRPSSTKC